MSIKEFVINLEQHEVPCFTKEVLQRSTEKLKTIKNKNESVNSLTSLRQNMYKTTKDLTSKYIKEIYKVIPSKNGKVEIGIFSSSSLESNKPICLFIHGGGFIGGNFHSYKDQCRLIAELSNSVVIAVNYRLAPENPFPKAIEDCISTYNWIYENSKTLNGDISNFYIIADSAGVSLSMALLKKENIKIKKLFNFYGCVDLFPERNPNYNWSIDTYGIVPTEKELLTGKLFNFSNNLNIFESYYLQNKENYTDPLISSIYESDYSYFPEMVYFEAEFDYFKPSNRYWYSNIGKFSDVIIYSYCGIDHGFLEHLGFYPESEHAIKTLSNIIVSNF